MKKNLILVALVLTLCLVGCNNNKQNTNNNENLNNNVQQDQTTNQNTQDNESEEKDDTPVVVYDSLDFSEKAGFKVVLGEALNDVECTSIFLINNTTTQFNLNFPDNVKGTLLIDPTNSSHLFSPDDETTIGETKVSIETGAGGILVYEWKKENYTYVFSTSADLKDSDKLSNLVNGVSIEKK